MCIIPILYCIFACQTKYAGAYPEYPVAPPLHKTTLFLDNLLAVERLSLWDRGSKAHGSSGDMKER